MSLALSRYTTSTWVWLIVAVLVFVSVTAAVVGRILYLRGIRVPFVVRLINNVSERSVTAVKRPITVAVLDEVASVLRSGNFTRNAASALHENHAEIKEMITQIIASDPATARSIGLLPFHERLIQEVIETVLRVIFEILDDPRTVELVSDILRDNISQIRAAVHDIGT